MLYAWRWSYIYGEKNEYYLKNYFVEQDIKYKSTKECKKCGFASDYNDEFCGNCGKKLEYAEEWTHPYLTIKYSKYKKELKYTIQNKCNRFFPCIVNGCVFCDAKIKNKTDLINFLDNNEKFNDDFNNFIIKYCSQYEIEYDKTKWERRKFLESYITIKRF